MHRFNVYKSYTGIYKSSVNDAEEDDLSILTRIYSLSKLNEDEYESLYYIAILTDESSKKLIKSINKYSAHDIGIDIDDVIRYETNNIVIIVANSEQVMCEIRNILIRFFVMTALSTANKISNISDALRLSGQIININHCIRYVYENRKHLLYFDAGRTANITFDSKIDATIHNNVGALKQEVFKYDFKKYNKLRYIRSINDSLGIILLDLLANENYITYFIDIITKHSILNYIDSNNNSSPLTYYQWKVCITTVLKNIMRNINSVYSENLLIKLDKLCCDYLELDNKSRIDIYKTALTMNICMNDISIRSSIIISGLWSQLSAFLSNGIIDKVSFDNQAVIGKINGLFARTQKLKEYFVKDSMYIHDGNDNVLIKSSNCGNKYTTIVREYILSFINNNKLLINMVRNYEIFSLLYLGMIDEHSIFFHIKDLKYTIINYICRT